jgi:hypothetical protein
MGLMSNGILFLHVFRSSNALTGVGVNEGIEWLCANISNAKRK